MTKTKRTRRQRREALARRKAAESASVSAEPVVDEPAVAEPPAEETIDAPGDDEPSPYASAEIRDTLDPGDVLVEMNCGDDVRIVVYEGMDAAEAAESAVAAYVVSLGRFPNDVVSATCYTVDSQWGPYPMELSLEVDATVLRAVLLLEGRND